MTLPADPFVRQLDALEEMGRPAQALKLALDALAREPENLLLLVRAASYAGQLEDYPQAVALASRAVAVAPDAGFPLAQLAQSQRLLGDHAAAHASALAALARDPDEALAHFELCTIEAIRADSAGFFRRQAHLRRGHAAAAEVERLLPDSPQGPALHAMLSAIGRRWPQHDEALARALARDPQDPLAHNVRLMGLQYRRSGRLLTEAHARLRAQPDDSYARQTLREQFSYAGWLAAWGSWRPVIVLILSLPLYGVWRTWRVWRYREAYHAVFTPPERRLSTLKHLALVPPGLMVVLLLLENSYPLAFTDRTPIYAPLWLMLAGGVLAVSLPAAFGGQGGFFGGAHHEAPRPRPAARRLTFRSAAGPTLLALLTGLFCLLTLLSLWANLGTPLGADTLGGLVLLGVLSVILVLLTLRAFQKARYGAPLAGRSLLDGVIALLTLGGLGLYAGTLWQGWQERDLLRGTVPLAGRPLAYWQYGKDGAVEDLISTASRACALPEKSRYVAVAVPPLTPPLRLTGRVESGETVTVPENQGQTACLSRIRVKRGFTLRAFPWPGRPLRLQEN